MDNHLKTLQLFYAGALVDALRQYDAFGITNKVEEKKQREQQAAAPRQLAQLEFDSPQAIFNGMRELFGCANWQLDTDDDGVTAVTKSCLLCALAQKTGAPQPCAMFCINPTRAFAAALEPTHTLTVNSRLWDGDACEFRMQKAVE